MGGGTTPTCSVKHKLAVLLLLLKLATSLWGGGRNHQQTPTQGVGDFYDFKCFLVVILAQLSVSVSVKKKVQKRAR